MRAEVDPLGLQQVDLTAVFARAADPAYEIDQSSGNRIVAITGIQRDIRGCQSLHYHKMADRLRQQPRRRSPMVLGDMTPGYSPLKGTAGPRGFFMTVGWGTCGFKAGPASGDLISQLIATGETPKLFEPFAPQRFATNNLIGEKAAASVSIDGGSRKKRVFVRL